MRKGLFPKKFLQLSVTIFLLSGFLAQSAWASSLGSSDQSFPIAIEDFFTTEETSQGEPLYDSPSRQNDLPSFDSSNEPSEQTEPQAFPVGQDREDPTLDPEESAFEDDLNDLVEAEVFLFDSQTEPMEEPEEEEGPTYDIPIVLNKSVEGYLDFFQTKLRDKFAVWLARSGRYLPIMRGIFKRYGLPEDLVYVALIESGFNPYAYSRARAVGPWQFIRGTGRMYGLRINRWVDERRDPIKSTDAAARHLKDLYERFGSWPLALASYNAGERRIRRALAKAKAVDYWDLRTTRHIRRETKGYVPKFMAATIIAKDPEQFGFSLDYHEPFVFDEVTVPGLASLRVIAKASGISYKELKKLNPELRTEVTPPYVTQYTLRLPPNTKESFETHYARIPNKKKLFRYRYIVKRNDTLSGIAQRFGTTVSLLTQMNHRSPRKILRVGETLYIPKVTASPRKSKKRKSFVQGASYQSNGDTDIASRYQIVYRIQVGDTLWDIARAFRISLEKLKGYNGIGRKSLIYPGDLLILGYK